MGLTGRLELRKNAEGRYRASGQHLPERHQMSTSLFTGLIAAGHLNGNVVELDTFGGPPVRYRVLPTGEDQPKTVIDLVLVDSKADTDDAVGGTASFEAWREKKGAVYARRDDHTGVSTSATTTEG